MRKLHERSYPFTINNMKAVILTPELVSELEGKFFQELQMTTQPIEDYYGNFVLPITTVEAIKPYYIMPELEVIEFYPKPVEDESDGDMVMRVDFMMQEDSAPMQEEQHPQMQMQMQQESVDVPETMMEPTNRKSKIRIRGLVLFIISQTLVRIFLFIGAVYTFFSLLFKKGWNAVDDWLFDCAYSDDQLGNVYMKGALNDFMSKALKEIFGKKDETISYAVAVLNRLNKFKPLGAFLYNVLEKIDPKDGGHAEKSIANEYLKAKQRQDFILHLNKFYPKKETALKSESDDVTLQ